MNVPLAVALYNCHPTSKNKVEVFLELDLSGQSVINFFYYYSTSFDTFISLSENANLRCKSTVTTILLRGSSPSDYNFCPKLENSSSNSIFKSNYFCGYSLSENQYCRILVGGDEQLQVDTLLVYYESVDVYLTPQFAWCNRSNLSQPSTKPFKTLVQIIESNTGIDSVINQTRLVATWKKILTLPSDFHLISFAFDHYLDSGLYSSNGWWYLFHDSGNVTIKEWVFEEKISVASHIDFTENPENYEWLEEDRLFNNHTGIILTSDFNRKRDAFKDFCRVMNLAAWDLREYDQVYRDYATNYSIRNGHACKNSKIYALPILKANNYRDPKIRKSSELIVNLYHHGVVNISVYSWKWTEEPTGEGTFRRKISTKKESVPKKGYGYPLDTCISGDIWRTGYGSNDILQKHDSSVKTILFYFYEDTNSVRLGATRTVRQRIVLFEKCKAFIYQNLNADLRIGFVSFGYSMVKNFERSPIALQNYVKYTYLLSDWAENQTNILVFLGQYVDTEIRIDYFNTNQEILVGWTSFDASTGTNISRRQQALETSKKHYPKQKYVVMEVVKNVNLTTRQIILVVCTSLVACVFIILVVVLLLNRYYKNNNLTNDEIAVFLNGAELSEHGAHKVQYDKGKYEINENNFKIEFDCLLGSGEFGAVYRGMVEKSTGELQVAIKTSNPQKNHKTQLTGLLSEIKMLAHIERHANITELLGANTAFLKKGIVYIFLEFCHLGSLQKYLKSMRLLVSSPIQETNVDEVTKGNTYSNACASKQTILDDALSTDLYRWSTQICNGMKFLAEKHVVHADLATRNILLNLYREAKICDFGLSRRMYNYTNYVKTQQEPLPWKWMAPEALRNMEFTEKTDVWAYGVTLWEIYSLASNPYAGLSWDANFSQMLEQGLCLSEPEYCERDMYKRMQKCWEIVPDNRPKFSELLLMLQSLDDQQTR